MTSDAKEVDHRIRLNREELILIRAALYHMGEEHRDEAIPHTLHQWQWYGVSKLISRLHPERLGRGRRW